MPHTSHRLVCCVLLAAGSAWAARLPHDQLLLWHDTNQVVRAVQTTADWQQRRAEILRGVQAVMGNLPGPEKRCPLEVKVEAETDCGSFVRRSITYQAEPGGRVPAYLCIPKAALTAPAKCPAVLCLHPTDAQIGNGVVVGLGGKAHRQYASELAGRGYVTIAPAYPLLANYQPDLKALGYASGTMKAIWDNLRALDVLEALPFVKRDGFGVIGHSLGGHNAVYTAVFDERLVAVVSSCGLDSFSDYMGGAAAVWTPEKGWCQQRYMPRLLDYAGRSSSAHRCRIKIFSGKAWIASLPPRPPSTNCMTSQSACGSHIRIVHTTSPTRYGSPPINYSMKF
ncbi:MAG: dienelactone hydrolase family protein [Kiritimatiellaeota bacterium]|nr:dienelactone hydrolase family protein [Kiritimatiellota bacterium]